MLIDYITIIFYGKGKVKNSEAKIEFYNFVGRVLEPELRKNSVMEYLREFTALDWRVLGSKLKNVKISINKSQEIPKTQILKRYHCLTGSIHVQNGSVKVNGMFGGPACIRLSKEAYLYFFSVFGDILLDYYRKGFITCNRADLKIPGFEFCYKNFKLKKIISLFFNKNKGGFHSKDGFFCDLKPGWFEIEKDLEGNFVARFNNRKKDVMFARICEKRKGKGFRFYLEFEYKPQTYSVEGLILCELLIKKEFDLVVKGIAQQTLGLLDRFPFLLSDKTNLSRFLFTAFKTPVFLERKVPFLNGKVERDWTVYPQMFKQTLPFLTDPEKWLLDKKFYIKVFEKRGLFVFI